MPLELAVRRLTFDSASAFGIYDRGLLQPGMAADLLVFDPDICSRSRRSISFRTRPTPTSARARSRTAIRRQARRGSKRCSDRP